MTGVIAPLRLEARTARALADAGCRVVASGIGAERARAAAKMLLAGGARRLLVWGTAGALSPDLRPGTLLIPALVVDTDGTHYATDAAWCARARARVPAGIPLSETPLATVAHPVSGREAKTAIGARTGAGAVDMEAGAIAALAAAHGVDFAVVRAIVDPLELALPPVVLAAISDRWLMPEVALRLLGRPQDFPAVFALARAMRRASTSLAAFAERLAAASNEARV